VPRCGGRGMGEIPDALVGFWGAGAPERCRQLDNPCADARSGGPCGIVAVIRSRVGTNGRLSGTRELPLGLKR
jgi:hypothetical protein